MEQILFIGLGLAMIAIVVIMYILVTGTLKQHTVNEASFKMINGYWTLSISHTGLGTFEDTLKK